MYGDPAPEPKKIAPELFERMLDCTDKYAGEHKSEPSVVSTLLLIDPIGYSGDSVYSEVTVQSCGFTRGMQAYSGLLEEEKERLGQALVTTLLAFNECE